VEENPGLYPDDVVLLVHSGSRGYGGNILKRYASDSHVSLKEGTDQMLEYMKEYDQALRWAQANRELIALRFLACLEPGEEAWEL
jgi:RNA-splicing ligase RtcB